MLLNSNYTNRIVSAALLAVLLFIHSIKLLHTHSYPGYSDTNPERVHVHCRNFIDVIGKSQPDCEICNYLLAKDSDEVYNPAGGDQIAVQKIFNSPFTSVTSTTFPFLFESRGPPVEI